MIQNEIVSGTIRMRSDLMPDIYRQRSANRNLQLSKMNRNECPFISGIPVQIGPKQVPTYLRNMQTNWAKRFMLKVPSSISSELR